MDLVPVQATPYVVRTLSNDRLHIRFRVGSRTADDGRCGIDNNWVPVSDSEFEEADPDRLCRYCFPDRD